MSVSLSSTDQRTDTIVTGLPTRPITKRSKRRALRKPSRGL